MDRELLKSIYYRATLFLFPSLFDSSSLVQIEAASQETPTIFIEGSVTSDTVDSLCKNFEQISEAIQTNFSIQTNLEH